MGNGNINKARTTVVDGDDDWPAAAYQPSRSDLLARHCYRTPRRFHQVTAWAACHGEHPYPDVDGDMIARSVAVELNDVGDLLVLIRPDLDRETRVRLLAKILEEEALKDSGTEDPDFPWPPPEPRIGMCFDDDEDDEL